MLMCRTEDSSVALGMLVRTSDSYWYSYVFSRDERKISVYPDKSLHIMFHHFHKSLEVLQKSDN